MMIAGDIDGNQVLNNKDHNHWKLHSGATGTYTLADLDGDGEEMEYPFNLQVIATPIPFLEELARPDQPELRDPNPMVMQPEECN